MLNSQNKNKSADFASTHLFCFRSVFLNQFLPGLLVNLNCFGGLKLCKNFQTQTSSFPVIFTRHRS